MIDITYDRFMIRQKYGRRGTIVDSDNDYVNDKNPLFGRINGATRSVIDLHVKPTKKRRRRGMGQRFNNCFKASARSAGRRRQMCVRSVRTHIWSKMKCGSANLIKTVPILHSMKIAHTNFSEKYIMIKS